MECVNTSNIAIITVKSADYRYIIHGDIQNVRLLEISKWNIGE